MQRDPSLFALTRLIASKEIGLFVSARADNQIVSLIASAAVCGVFYLIGTPVLTAFFGTAAGNGCVCSVPVLVSKPSPEASSTSAISTTTSA